ncbi:MAG: hypothetical protein E7480_08130 [Ruminococcaceae bacterium]|nr:hypothetical protein [Oscillospiraceae bacterium]
MKKGIALLLILSMLFALTACGRDNESTESMGTITDITESSGNSTDGEQDGIQSTTVEDTTQTSESTGTEALHTHSYNSKVTTSATCNTDGVKTFTCSCGDTYTEKIAAAGHTWSNWKVENRALVGRVGTEKRTCSVCSVSETKNSTANDITNSFFDWALVTIIMNNYGDINASSLLEYALCTFDEYIDKPVASATVFAALSERFNIDFNDTLKNEMKEIGEWRYGYNKENDTFTFYVYGLDPGKFKLLGYVYNGGSKYTTYYSFTPHGIDTTLNFAVELEYKKLNGKPNKYLSIGQANKLPDNMIKCPVNE